MDWEERTADMCSRQVFPVGGSRGNNSHFRKDKSRNRGCRWCKDRMDRDWNGSCMGLAKSHRRGTLDNWGRHTPYRMNWNNAGCW